MTGAQRIPLSNDKVNRSIYTEMAKRGRWILEGLELQNL
jgi:hypothetical protein